MQTIEEIRARAEAAMQWVKQRTCASDITSGESGKIRRSLEIDIPFLLGEIERLTRKSQNQSNRIGELMQALECGHKRAETAESELTEALEAARHSNAKFLREKERADKAVEDGTLRKETGLTPIYTCGGHGGYEDDDDEDFWCPICNAHLGTHRGFQTLCPRCGQRINHDSEPLYNYRDMRKSEREWRGERSENDG